MLLATSRDMTASIWNVPSGTTWPFSPHVKLECHAREITCGAFLGDESHVITGSWDTSLLICRTLDGVQTANYKSYGAVCHSFVYYIAHLVCYAGGIIVVSCCVGRHFSWS